MNKIIGLIAVCLFCSCNESKNDELTGIPVDIEQNVPLPLSTIADEIVAIELEMTDESLINTDNIQRVLFSDKNIIIAERLKIYVFNRDGKFIRSIGSRGQGPGEYRTIVNLTMDEKNNSLFVNCFNKIICYDLEGKFLKEKRMDQYIKDMNFVNGELFIIGEDYGENSKGFFFNSVMYKLNNDLQITDSLPIRDTYFKMEVFNTSTLAGIILLRRDTFMSLYLADINKYPLVNVLRDTLYHVENNLLIPDVKLNFKNNGISNGEKFIELYNMYRSSRYVFALYANIQNENFYYFCFDTKTGTGYNMQDGYKDDIHQIGDRQTIRPLSSDTEMFYYLHTHMKPGDLEEPNPTLYIGKLKK